MKLEKLTIFSWVVSHITNEIFQIKCLWFDADRSSSNKHRKSLTHKQHNFYCLTIVFFATLFLRQLINKNGLRQNFFQFILCLKQHLSIWDSWMKKNFNTFLVYSKRSETRECTFVVFTYSCWNSVRWYELVKVVHYRWEEWWISNLLPWSTLSFVNLYATQFLLLS